MLSIYTESIIPTVQQALFHWAIGILGIPSLFGIKSGANTSIHGTLYKENAPFTTQECYNNKTLFRIVFDISADIIYVFKLTNFLSYFK